MLQYVNLILGIEVLLPTANHQTGEGDEGDEKLRTGKKVNSYTLVFNFNFLKQT